MNTKHLSMAGLVAATVLLAGCEHDSAFAGPDVSTFGEPNRQTMMAQVVDPDPEYDYGPHESSAEQAADAIDRYRNDKVKKPDSIRSTEGSGSGS